MITTTWRAGCVTLRRARSGASAPEAPLASCWGSVGLAFPAAVERSAIGTARTVAASATAIVSRRALRRRPAADWRRDRGTFFPPVLRGSLPTPFIGQPILQLYRGLELFPGSRTDV